MQSGCSGHRRHTMTDRELKPHVENALAAVKWNTVVPPDRFTLAVRNGWTTLKGVLKRGIANDIVVKPRVSARPLAAALLLGAVTLASVSPLAQALQKSMYVSVVDQAGAPVLDLGPSDFIVREDNVAREVLKVVPADEP